MPYDLPDTPPSPESALARSQRILAASVAASRLRASERNFASLRQPGAFRYA